MGQNAQGPRAVLPAPLIRFGPFELDSRAGELRKHGIRVRLQEQPLQILLMLLESPGDAVLREDIRIRLWPNNTIVEFDHSINAAIKRLRDALCESAEEPRYVETLARRGYRFIGQLEVAPNGAAASEPSTTIDHQPAKEAGDLMGQTICTYRVLEQLGSGGMGVVYRAEDLKLGRTVALKFLLEELAGDPAALARFEQEARTASALSHPHICSIFGVEEWQGRPFIAMELVEGETLASRIGKGRLPLDQALSFAIQIADAIDAAHSKGIIHRDLKPENVMLAKSKVKVLDFGLAKTRQSAAETRVTRPGMVVGTLHFLSPEQLLGNPADMRSDIFAFGLLLYQLLTGRHAFQGESAAAIIGAILHAEPVLDEIPEPLRRIVSACLAKDSETRWQSARDLKRELEWAALPNAVEGAPLAMGISNIWKIAGGGGAVLGLLALGLVLRHAQPLRGQSLYHLTIATPKLDVSDGGRMALSRDGRQIAFISMDESGVPHLMVRSLDSDVVRMISSATDARNYPFWSPDGRSVGYYTSDSLSVVDLGNGQTRKLAATNPITRGATWGSKGQILFTGPSQLSPGIYAIPESGGEPKQATFGARGVGQVYPQFLADGKRFLFSVETGGTGTEELRLGTLGSAETRLLGTIAGNVAVAGPEVLVFRRAETLFAQRVNPATLAFLGEPVRLVDNIRYYAINGFGNFSVSDTGALAFRRGGNTKTRLAWFDRNGGSLGDIGQPGPYWSFDLSNDESTIAASRDDDVLGIPQLWHGQVERGPSVRLTGSTDPERFPAWSPDGKRLCYVRERNQRSVLSIRDFAGTGDDRVLMEGSNLLKFPNWSPDGRFVAVVSVPPGGGFHILLLPVEGSTQATQLIPSETFSQTMPQFSPDGRWIAYVSMETGAPEVYVRPFPDVTLGKWRVSSGGGGVQPRWRRDGREILYVDHANRIVAVPVTPQAKQFQMGQPVALFKARLPWSTMGRYQFAVSRDGQRILANVQAEEDDRAIEMLIHWDTLLK